MKTRTNIIRLGRAALLALTAGVILSACGVTGPDETPWQQVSAYSWPTATGTFLRYRVEESQPTRNDSITQATIESSSESFHNQQMYTLHDSRPLSYRVMYGATNDTLFVQNEEFGGTYHLVAPLERGHTWISGYSDDAETVPRWRATILERLSYLQLEGKRYQNVVVVRYDYLDTAAPDYGTFWLRYYAQGQGPIQTVKHQPISANPLPAVQPEPGLIKKIVLIESTAASN
jgi:hypothetical protein